MIDVDADQRRVARVISAGLPGMVADTADEEALVDANDTAAAGEMAVSARTLMDILRREHETASDHVASLRPLEHELLDLNGQGLSNTEIGAKLRLASGTVRNYVPGDAQALR